MDGSSNIEVSNRRGCTVDHATVALGRRLMAVPGYEPATGMRGVDNCTVEFVARGRVYFCEGWDVPVTRFVPDLEHGATQGVLLEQLREMYQEPRMCLVYIEESEDHREGWQVHTHPGCPVGGGMTRGLALVNAVENWAMRVRIEAREAACVDALNTEPGGYASATGGAL